MSVTPMPSISPYDDADALESVSAVKARNSGLAVPVIRFIDALSGPPKPVRILPITHPDTSDRICRKLAGAAGRLPVQFSYDEPDLAPVVRGDRAESRYKRGRWKTVRRGTLHVLVGCAWKNQLKFVATHDDGCFGSTPEEVLSRYIDRHFPVGRYSANYRETVRELSLCKLVAEKLAA